MIFRRSSALASPLSFSPHSIITCSMMSLADSVFPAPDSPLTMQHCDTVIPDDTISEYLHDVG